MKMSEKNPRPDNGGFRVVTVVCALLGIASLAVCALLTVYTDYPPVNIALTSLGIYAGICIVLLTVMFITSSLPKNAGSDIRSSNFGAISLDFIQKLYMPVLICDEKGKIVWYNQALSSKFKTRGVLYGKYIDNICNATIERIIKSDTEEGAEVFFESDSEVDLSVNNVYRARGYRVTAKSKVYYMTVFNDITRIKSLQKELSDEDTVIAYVLIDNLDELTQYVLDVYNTVESDVATILKAEMDSIGGVIREYGHNKFICIFAQKYLEEMEKDKFSLLDKIREISIGETSMPVTASVGIAKIKGTLAEKERATQAALDMALQRGGDQAVVKYSDGVDFYGGKTKTVQKRTKVRSRVIANELIMLISKSDNVIIMGHKFADYDAFASCVAVRRIAEFCGVKAYIVMDKNDKNLAGCFEMLSGHAEYKDIFVDKIEAQDLIKSETLAVVCDVNNLAFCEAPDIVNTARNVIIIDHHRKTAEFKSQPAIAYIEPSASSASELMSEFLEQLLPPGSLPSVEANLLFAGIILDTKRFSHNAGVRTFSSALYLRGEGADPMNVQDLFKTSMRDFLNEANFENNAVIYKSVIAIALNESDTNTNLSRVNAAKAADRLLGVEGVQAAFALCRIDDTVHISARSQGNINVQFILEKMGGGGHFDSAGAQVKSSSTGNALTMLRAAIDEYLAENFN